MRSEVEYGGGRACSPECFAGHHDADVIYKFLSVSIMPVKRKLEEWLEEWQKEWA